MVGRLVVVGLVLFTSIARADDDDDDASKEPTATWRITIDADSTSHTEVSSSESTVTHDYTWKANLRLTADLPASAVSGPDFTINTDDVHGYKATQEVGTVSIDEHSTVYGKLVMETKLTGAIKPGAVKAGLRYTKGLDAYEFHLRVPYASKGTTSAAGQGTKPVTDDGGHDLMVMFGTKPFVDASPDAKFSRSGNTFTVDYHYVSTGKPGSKNKLDVHVHAVFEPATEPKYVAVIRPADRKAYAAWVPQGPKIPGGDDAKGGNDLDLIVEVHDKKTGKPAPVTYALTWKIAGSKLPGWAMNYPKKADANDHWDLFFDGKKNHGHTIADDGESMSVPKNTGDAIATITSRDYGAFGRVDAFLTLTDGTTLTAHEEHADGTIATGEGIAIPKDDNGNHVADQWEIDNHVGTSRAPSWDEEDLPTGMYNKGDGFDLFEEYRGFAVADPAAALKQAASPHGTWAKAVKMVHQRLDPGVRELFVMIEAGALEEPMLRYGSLRYGVITGIKVYFVPDKDLLEPLPGDMDAAHPRKLTTRMTPNTDLYGPEQAAVWVTTLVPGGSSAGPGNTPFINHPDDEAASKMYGSPTQIEAVRVYTHNIFGLLKALEAYFGKSPPPYSMAKKSLAQVPILAAKHPDWHLTVDGIYQYATTHEAELEAQVIEFVVFHELGHATGARHHLVDEFVSDKIKSQEESYGEGEPTCPMRYWHYHDPEAVVLLMSGHWRIPDETQRETAWTFCDQDWPSMRLWQDPAELTKRGKH